jgi:arsenite-transporting ATPase
VLTDDGSCPLCDERRSHERQAIAAIRRSFGRGRHVRLLPAEIREPRGVAALSRLWSKRVAIHRPRTAPRGPRPVHLDQPSILERLRRAELVFVGGKGGVGKTTVAAAVAQELARSMPGEPILLLSADPAHSLGDVFGRAVGDEPTRIPRAPSNLVVRELDAAAALESRRAALAAALDELGSLFGSAGTTAEELIDLAPPGIDELFAMLSVLEARAAHRVIVVDMAPTGHALRLLAMPDTVKAWTQVLLRVLLKYRSIARPGRFAAELVETSKSVRALQAALRDSEKASFVVVTRAAAVPRAETERLLRQLRRLKLATAAVVVNARTMTPGRCRRCRAVDAAERRELTRLARSFGSGRGARACAIIQTPLAATPPRGPSGLERWARTWIA